MQCSGWACELCKHNIDTLSRWLQETLAFPQVIGIQVQTDSSAGLEDMLPALIIKPVQIPDDAGSTDADGSLEQTFYLCLRSDNRQGCC